MGLFFAVVSAHVLLVLYDGEEIALDSPLGVVLALLLLLRDSQHTRAGSSDIRRSGDGIRLPCGR